jgi:hypothetical protein
VKIEDEFGVAGSAGGACLLPRPDPDLERVRGTRVRRVAGEANRTADAEQCARRLRGYRDLGCAGVILALACGPGKFDEMAAFVMREVRPRVAKDVEKEKQ